MVEKWLCKYFFTFVLTMPYWVFFPQSRKAEVAKCFRFFGASEEKYSSFYLSCGNTMHFIMAKYVGL